MPEPLGVFSPPLVALFHVRAWGGVGWRMVCSSSSVATAAVGEAACAARRVGRAGGRPWKDLLHRSQHPDHHMEPPPGPPGWLGRHDRPRSSAVLCEQADWRKSGESPHSSPCTFPPSVFAQLSSQSVPERNHYHALAVLLVVGAPILNA